ncbi:MAG TPA: hypothetical protein DDZ81_26655 [Acetobacteraceae bacterium]|jgi:hypothetical protein|nr:hypothetical protein [Acetobacteraceae bacterium]
MTTPIILQMQRALLDSSTSLSKSLLKAKVVCFKLGLAEFEAWVDSENEGYMGKETDELPEYRILGGTPEAFNPYHGWQPMGFANAELKRKLSYAPIGMSIGAIEHSLCDTKSDGMFEFTYSPEMETKIRQALSWSDARLRIRLTVPQVAAIVEKVRSILLRWTLEMEKQGMLGNDLVFNEEDKEKSARVTEGVVNNIHIAQVGSFVQAATNSNVHGEVKSAGISTEGVRDLVQQVGQMLPASNLPQDIQDNTRAALQQLTEAQQSDKPDGGRLRKGFDMLKGALAPAGEHLLRVAVDAAVTKLVGPG